MRPNIDRYYINTISMKERNNMNSDEGQVYVILKPNYNRGIRF